LSAASDPEGRAVEMDGIIEAAKARLGEVEIDRGVLDYLYGRSRYQEMEASAWREDVRLATAVESVLADERFIPRLVKRLVDMSVREKLRAHVAPGEAAIILIFHGGFTSMTRPLLRLLLDDKLEMRAKGTEFGVRDDPATALFAARARLLDGKPLVIGADGEHGKMTGSIDVLGAQCPVADGPPFLAHLTGCSTLWFAAVRSEDGFAHQIIQGPRREDGEPFVEFRSRFYEFYARCLTDWFSGDPRNLAMRQRWIKKFSQARKKPEGRSRDRYSFTAYARS
jgi:hypothetical protein